MKLLIDTNIIVDILETEVDRPGVEASYKIVDFCQMKLLGGYLYALSIPNVLYILRKKLRPGDTDGVVNSILRTFEVEDLKAQDLKDALKLGFRDYEDALQSACAERIGADYIITHNVKDFEKSSVPALTPSEFLKKVVVSS